MPSFGTSSRVIVRKDNSIICNITWFFREDLNWRDFINVIAAKFRYAKDVNVLNLGCSDGSEPLSLMTGLLHFAREYADKFFPIKAFDIDEKIISDAKSGIYNIRESDLRTINNTLGTYTDYFSMTSRRNSESGLALKLLPAYSKNVTFEQMNLLDTIKYLKPLNNIVLCRNVLPYLKEEDRELFINNLSNRMDDSSLLVIGSFDRGHNVDDLIRSKGFVHYGNENVFIKGAAGV